MKLGKYDLSELIQLFNRQPERVGIELEDRNVRIVRIAKNKEKQLRIMGFSELNLDIRQSGLVDKQRFRTTVRKIGGGLQRVAGNMEHPTLRVRRMDFAKMPESDLLEAIRWNFREHVDVPIEKYVVGYTPIEGFAEKNRLALVAYGVSEDAVIEYSDLIKSYGLKLVALEPAATALLAAFNANGVLQDGKCHVCISFGSLTTYFVVMKGTSMLFSRPLSGASFDSMVKLVVRNMNLEVKDARALLDDYLESSARSSKIPVNETEKFKEIKMTVGHFFSQMVIEIQRSIDAFCIMYGLERVDQIHICGQGIRYPDVVSYIKKTLGVETNMFNPFDKLMDAEQKSDDTLRYAPLYATAVGLAIP